MSVQEHTSSVATTTTSERSVYQSLFDKINLAPVSTLKNVDAWQSDEALSDAAPAERVTAAIQVLVSCLADAAQPLERLDKTLLDEQIARLDKQISDQVNEVMHHAEFQKQESLWRGLHSMITGIDFRRNVRVEMMDISKDALRDDFDDAPELIQSGLYRHVYIEEYDQPGGEPIAAMISAYEFDNSPQDIALLRNISGVSAACHMPFIGAVGPKFFLKENMEEVAAIKDINDYFERAEYIKWKAFRDSDDSRYIGLTMPRVLGRLPYGPDTVPVRSFNYVEEVKGPDHEKYLWTSASFSFAVNMVKSFIKNGWCVQIRGPQAGGAVKDLPIHLYDLGTGNQVKIPSEVMIPETREFEFANLGFIPLSYYKNRDYACFFSANSAQKPAQFDTPEATANSRINSRLPYIFLLSRIAHYLKILQRENIGTTKDRRLLELELNNWLRSLVTRAGSPWDKHAAIIISDLKMLLHRMPGLETLAFNDGTPFADDVTREWIARDVLQESDWQADKIAAATVGKDDDILLLESEALTLADSEGVEAALAWLQARPGIISRRQRWLRQLLMARLTEQCGRNDLALHLLGELNTTAHSLTLKQWEPELLFEVKARRLKLLRLKANRSESDKARLASEMESLLSGLVAIDPARAAVLCG